MVVGRPLSHWEGKFSGAMLNFGRVSGILKELGLMTFRTFAPFKGAEASQDWITWHLFLC